MSSERNPQSENESESVLRENAALKKTVEHFSCQVYGRVMPGLFPFSGGTENGFSGKKSPPAPDEKPGNDIGILHEPSAAYHVSVPTSVPPDLPTEDITLELPPEKRGGMSVAGYEPSEAVAARPAVIRHAIRRAMYVSNDGSGMAGAAPAPALFSDPSGGPQMFEASFVAFVTNCHMAGMTFRVISRLLETESGLAISETALRGLVLAAAETVEPVCSALITRTLPDWSNLRRMFEEAKSGGDWLADEFLKPIHALRELEEYARIRADRLGGAPEDLYRERRTARTESARITERFFRRCRETLSVLNPQTPLAETLRHALEHESCLSGFLYDPRLEMSCSNPETPVADPFAALAVCADECRMRGVPFRVWLEDTLVKLKQPNPPSPESLFPR